MAVEECVQLVCNAFEHAAELLRQVRTSRALHGSRPQDAALVKDMQIQDLQLSLNRGGSVIRSQYDRDYKRFGTIFANGDRELSQGIFPLSHS